MDFIFEFTVPKKFFRIYDYETSLNFFMYIVSDTGLRNWEATNTSIYRIAVSAVFLTFIPILISILLLVKALSKVDVPMLANVSIFS